jgi:hypothetical protein
MNDAGTTEFRRKLKEEWALLWKERFDDRVMAEGVAVRDYPLLFTDRGCVIFASRNVRIPNFSEIIESWVSKGADCSPAPYVGGWGKFIRTELRKITHPRAEKFEKDRPQSKRVKSQLKKNGRGWLHL